MSYGSSLHVLSGHIVKNRGLWFAVIPYYDAEGKRRTKSRSTKVRCGEGGTGRRKALEFLEAWRGGDFAEELARERRASNPSEATFAEFAQRAIEELELEGLAEQTLTKYRSILRNIEAMGPSGGTPPLHAHTLQEVIDEPSLIRGFYQQLFARGLSRATVTHYMSFCRRVFSVAVASDVVQVNPFCKKSNKPPRPRKRPVNYVDPDEVRRVMGVLSAMEPGPFRTTVEIVLSTGMRRSEISGLRWADVDFAGNVIRVRGSLVVARRDGGGREFEWGPPKEDSSMRDIPMTSGLRRFLLGLKYDVQETLEGIGKGWDPYLYVTGNPATGGYHSPHSVSMEWKSFSEIMGLRGSTGERPTFHDLRHTFAVLAIASGMDVETLARILGHANASMTLDIYGDALHCV